MIHGPECWDCGRSHPGNQQPHIHRAVSIDASRFTATTNDDTYALVCGPLGAGAGPVGSNMVNRRPTARLNIATIVPIDHGESRGQAITTDAANLVSDRRE